MKELDWTKVTQTLAVSGGQWCDNGFPLLFELVLMEDSDEMHLIVKLESCHEDWGIQYYEALKEFGNGKIIISSHFISIINQAMRLYTNDYVDFEWDEDYQEYFGTCQ